MQDNYIDQFQNLLAWVRQNRMASIETLTIDLSIARNDTPLEVTGIFIYGEDASDNTASLQIRHNERENGLITLTKSYGTVFPFYRLLLTNAAQAGKTITLTIGRASPFQIVDNRSGLTLVTALEDILDQLKGRIVAGNYGADITVGTSAVKVLDANADRRSAVVQSDISNGGIIYIGYDNNVGSGYKVATLLPGGAFSADDVCGEIWAISGVAGQLVSASEV